MHCHLGFLDKPAAFAREAEQRGVACLSCTVEPDERTQLLPQLKECGNVSVGLGLHPWWVAADDAARKAQLAAFARQAASARLIGEVGLDFGRAHAGTREAQEDAFRRICSLCAQPPAPSPLDAAPARRVLSIHAVHAAGAVLDILEETEALASCICMFHWFSGSGEDLARARDAGCLFSVNPRMLVTRRGRAYAQQIPADRLLLETDLPGAAGEALEPATHRAVLESALDVLCTLHREPDLPALIARTSRDLLARCS